ncbi:MAG: fumarylacetoacetate hydrolase family protein [Prevotellaceae bacterium]|jgi:2-keto-4-pentenoate hydratase/2-oxohepta-3-ene-1,7-dioic acid hydratase in catechol pathway|nr:fumarylacetoacetate hydrolase family protein [Prevotellaceae bacterium]
MKIICIGWNYPSHNSEMQRENLPKTPTVFLKPDSALRRNNQPFFIPDFSSEIDYETELVIRIERLGKNIDEKFAHRYYTHIGLGIDFTARDLQRQLKANGAPWELSKAFDGAAAISDFLPIDTLKTPDNIPFKLFKNGIEVQNGSSAEMIFNFDRIVAYVSRFFTLKTGDLIYTGTPSGVGMVAIGDRLEGYIENQKMLTVNIR